MKIRPIPASPESEMAILAKSLKFDESLSEMLPLCREEFFFEEKNKEIFRILTELSKSQEKVELAEVFAKIKDPAQNYLYEIINSNMDVGSNVKRLTNVLRDKCVARKIISLSDQAKNFAYDGDGQKSLQFLLQNLLDLEDFVSSDHTYASIQLKTWYKDVLISRIANGGNANNISYGFKTLDGVTGGARPGQFINVIARTSQGKSAFLQNLALNFIRDEKNTLFISLESSREEVMDRLAGNLTGLGHVKLRDNLREDELQTINESLEQLGDGKFVLDDDPHMTTDIIYMKASHLRYQGKLDCLLVDYLQNLFDDSRADNEERRLAKISSNLKRIARNLEIPVISACQLNRESTRREDPSPQLTDIRYCGQIEQDSDVVIGLWREEETPDISNFKILKNRNGKLGYFRLRFDPKLCRFSETT